MQRVLTFLTTLVLSGSLLLSSTPSQSSVVVSGYDFSGESESNLILAMHDPSAEPTVVVPLGSQSHAPGLLGFMFSAGVGTAWKWEYGTELTPYQWIGVRAERPFYGRLQLEVDYRPELDFSNDFRFGQQQLNAGLWVTF